MIPHGLQVASLLVAGVAMSVAAWRWVSGGHNHPPGCGCERCRRRGTDRYISQLLADRERRDEAARFQ